MFDPQWRDVEVVGEVTGTKYTGRFYLKPYLNHEERSDAIRLAELYCRGIERSEGQKLFLTTLAFLRFHIRDTDAEWWKNGSGLKMDDESPVYEIGKKLEEVQDHYNPKAKIEEKK